MRVRITTRMDGSVDGIDLTHFEVGQIYDLGPVLANYLLASGYGVPVRDESPATADDRPTRKRPR